MMIVADKLCPLFSPIIRRSLRDLFNTAWHYLQDMQLNFSFFTSF